MPHYCAYSFAQLFEAAEGRVATEAENQKLAALDQAARNQFVRQLAKKAAWQCRDVVSLEGETFTAFWPKEKSRQRRD